MKTIDDNLNMIDLAKKKKYEIRKNSDKTYSVYDKESILAAFYENNKWTYGVYDVYNSPVSFIGVPIDAYKDLEEFTKLLVSGN